MQREDGGSGPSWGITDEGNLAGTDLDNIVNVPAATVAFGSTLIDNNHISDPCIGPTLLIGLDKHFFEQGDNTRDVIFIENSELKIDSTQIKINSEDKSFLTAGSYVISFVEADKESSWDEALLRNSRKHKENHDYCDKDNDEYQQNETAMADNSEISKRYETFLVEPTTAKNVLCIGPTSVPDSRERHYQCKETFTSGNVTNNNKNTLYAPCTTFQNDDVPSTPGSANDNTMPIKKKIKIKGPESACKDSPITASTSNADPPLSVCEPSVLTFRKKLKKRLAGKRRCCYSDTDSSGEDEGLGQSSSLLCDSSEFHSMTDVVIYLKKQSVIDDEFAELINSGLAEMEVDIFQELGYGAREIDSAMKLKPSYQLLTFAFLIYFKCRPAYRILHQIFEQRWPTVDQLKAWRQLVNSVPKNRRKKQQKHSQ